MGYLYGKTNVGKHFYNIFASIVSVFDLTALTAPAKALLMLFKMFTDSEIIVTNGAIALTNSSSAILYLTGASSVTYVGLTDSKPRIIVNRKETGDITIGSITLTSKQSAIISNDTVALLNLIPIGSCNDAPSLKTQKGDSVKTNDGITNVTSSTTGFELEYLSLNDKSIVDEFDRKALSVVFAEINNDTAYVIQNTVFNVELDIQGNGQNKALISSSTENIDLLYFENYTA